MESRSFKQHYFAPGSVRGWGCKNELNPVQAFEELTEKVGEFSFGKWSIFSRKQYSRLLFSHLPMLKREERLFGVPILQERLTREIFLQSLTHRGWLVLNVNVSQVWSNVRFNVRTEYIRTIREDPIQRQVQGDWCYYSLYLYVRNYP